MIKRGDIYLVDLTKFKLELNGDYQNNIQTKKRPCVVIQNDVGNRYSPNLIISAGTSKLDKRNLPTHFTITKDQYYPDLKMDTTFMMEMVYTVPKEWIEKEAKYLLSVNNMDLRRLNKCIAVSMGLETAIA